MIKRVKQQSQQNPSTLTLETRRQREFLRYEDGSLIEYDLTKAKGKQIVLTAEEIEGLREFYA